MYRKYIDLDEKRKSEVAYAVNLESLFDIGDTVRYCRADVEATLNLFRDTVHNPYSILPADIKLAINDGSFRKARKLYSNSSEVTNNKVLFIFEIMLPNAR